MKSILKIFITINFFENRKWKDRKAWFKKNKKITKEIRRRKDIKMVSFNIQYGEKQDTQPAAWTL